MSIRIKRIKLNGNDNRPSLSVFIYLGNENPVEVIDKAVSTYVEDNEFYEFVDDNMDNPWTRVVVKEILEGFQVSQMQVEGRIFDVYHLHKSGNIEIVYITYVIGDDKRPHPIMDLAKMDLANRRGYNSFIDSNISDLWSRLIIFGINDIPQEPFNTQRL